MFEALKKTFKQIKQDPPGKRFRRQYRRRKKARQNAAGKFLLIGLGIVIVLGGIIMLPAPGPGMLVIFLGLALVAQEWLWLSLLLDKLELLIRKFINQLLKYWQRRSMLRKSIIIIAALALAALVCYGAWVWFVRGYVERFIYARFIGPKQGFDILEVLMT